MSTKGQTVFKKYGADIYTHPEICMSVYFCTDIFYGEDGHYVASDVRIIYCTNHGSFSSCMDAPTSKHQSVEDRDSWCFEHLQGIWASKSEWWGCADALPTVSVSANQIRLDKQALNIY